MRVEETTVVCMGSQMEEHGLIIARAWSSSPSRSGGPTGRGKAWRIVT